MSEVELLININLKSENDKLAEFERVLETFRRDTLLRHSRDTKDSLHQTPSQPQKARNNALNFKKMKKYKDKN